MSEFKVGGKVVCISSRGASDSIIEGNEYEIEHFCDFQIKLVGVPNYWDEDRFELVEFSQEEKKEFSVSLEKVGAVCKLTITGEISREQVDMIMGVVYER